MDTLDLPTCISIVSVFLYISFLFFMRPDKKNVDRFSSFVLGLFWYTFWLWRLFATWAMELKTQHSQTISTNLTVKQDLWSYFTLSLSPLTWHGPAKWRKRCQIFISICPNSICWKQRKTMKSEIDGHLNCNKPITADHHVNSSQSARSTLAVDLKCHKYKRISIFLPWRNIDRKSARLRDFDHECGSLTPGWRMPTSTRMYYAFLSNLAESVQSIYQISQKYRWIDFALVYAPFPKAS